MEQLREKDGNVKLGEKKEKKKKTKKIWSFSLIERVILSAGAMLIFSVSFQIDQMPEGTTPGAY